MPISKQSVSESLKALVNKCVELVAKVRQLLTPSENPLKRLKNWLMAALAWLSGAVKNCLPKKAQGSQPKAEQSTTVKPDRT